MRNLLLPVPIFLLALGCGQPSAAPLQPGDVVRAEVSFAPKSPWHEGAKVAIGMLLKGERTNGQTYYLIDEDVVLERAVMRCRLTFLDGDRIVGEPHEVPFVHDC